MPCNPLIQSYWFGCVNNMLFCNALCVCVNVYTVVIIGPISCIM